jgi:hypothetical protein
MPWHSKSLSVLNSGNRMTKPKSSKFRPIFLTNPTNMKSFARVIGNPKDIRRADLTVVWLVDAYPEGRVAFDGAPIGYATTLSAPPAKREAARTSGGFSSNCPKSADSRSRQPSANLSWLNYLLRIRRNNAPAEPTRPVPSISRELGSGTGAMLP